MKRFLELLKYDVIYCGVRFFLLAFGSGCILGAILSVLNPQGWVYRVMGVIISSLAIPSSCALMSTQYTNKTTISGAIGSFVLAIITWYVTIDMDSIGGENPQLFCNLVSIVSSALICAIITAVESDRTNSEQDMKYKIFSAIKENNISALKILLKSGLDINKKFGGFGQTALIVACHEHHLEMIKFLVENGADPNSQTDDGCTALIVASFNGQFEIVKFLAEHGADPNAKFGDFEQTPVIVASQQGHFEIIKVLIKHGADPNAKNSNGFTLIMKAADKGHFEMVKFLVENGGDLNENSNDGLTALMYASDRGHFEMVKFLLENGANINAKSNRCECALIQAFTHGHLAMTVYLLEHGANSFHALDMENMVMKLLIIERIEEINEIRRVMETVIFPHHTPVMAKMIADFTDGLANLENYLIYASAKHLGQAQVI